MHPPAPTTDGHGFNSGASKYADYSPATQHADNSLRYESLMNYLRNESLTNSLRNESLINSLRNELLMLGYAGGGHSLRFPPASEQLNFAG